MGFADLLHSNADDGDEAKREKWLRTILHSSQHLLELINDVLDLSKIEAGHFEIDKGRCSLVEIVTSVASILESRAAEKGLLLAPNYRGAVPETISGLDSRR